MSTSEFFRWKVYIALDRNRPNKTDYYLASIAREVRTVLMSREQSNRVKLDDMIIKFKEPPRKPRKTKVVKRKSQSPDEVPEEVKKRVTASKAMWFGLLGIKEKPEYGR